MWRWTVAKKQRRRRLRAAALQEKLSGHIQDLALRVTLVLQFAFSATAKCAKSWLNSQRVAQAMRMWTKDVSIEEAGLTKMELERDKSFTDCMSKAREKAASGCSKWKVRSFVWASVIGRFLRRDEKLAGHPEQDSWDGEAASSTTKIIVLHEPYREFKTLEPLQVDTSPLVINGKQMTKSPNKLYAQCGYPKELRYNNEMKGSNCCINSWLFIFQEVLRRGYYAAFQELCEFIEEDSTLGNLMRALIFTGGKTTMATEKLKTSFVLDIKQKLVDEADITGVDIFQLWAQDPLPVWTLKAKALRCHKCNDTQDVQNNPNLTKEEYLQVSGRAEVTTLKDWCSNCQEDTVRDIVYVLPTNVLFVDAGGSQKRSDCIEEVLREWPSSVELLGNDDEFELIVAPTEEWYSCCKGHQYLTRREADGSVSSIDDGNPGVWAEPFCPNSWPLNITGALLGRGRKGAAGKTTPACPATLLGGDGTLATSLSSPSPSTSSDLEKPILHTRPAESDESPATFTLWEAARHRYSTRSAAAAVEKTSSASGRPTSPSATPSSATSSESTLAFAIDFSPPTDASGPSRDSTHSGSLPAQSDNSNAAPVASLPSSGVSRKRRSSSTSGVLSGSSPKSRPRCSNGRFSKKTCHG